MHNGDPMTQIIPEDVQSVLFKPNLPYNFLEVSPQFWVEFQKEWRTRILAIQSGIDSPTAVDKLVAMLMQDATITLYMKDSK